MELQQDNTLLLSQGERIALYLALTYSHNCMLDIYNQSQTDDASILNDIYELCSVMYNMCIGMSTEMHYNSKETRDLIKQMQRLESYSTIDSVREGYRVYLDILHELANYTLSISSPICKVTNAKGEVLHKGTYSDCLDYCKDAGWEQQSEHIFLDRDTNSFYSIFDAK